jgi:Tfp pilus assembly PilM family ATPase
MLPKVLGLDISCDTIKVILLETRGRLGGRILAAETINVHECGGIIAALKKLAENTMFTSVPCSVSLPLQEIMFRQVTLPFHDESKIRKTLSFELEPLIPFSVDEIVADYLPVGASGLLVAATTKKNISQWIEIIERNLGVVHLLSTSAVPLALLMPEKQSVAASGLLVDIGSTSTTLISYENGSIVDVRSIAFGGRPVTEALADDFSAEKEEAAQIKISGNYVDIGAKTKVICSQFCQELKNTIEFLMINETLKKYPAKITLTGGGSLFVPLQKEIANYLSLPLELLDLSGLQQIEIPQNIRDKYQPQIMNVALADALSLSASVRSFNFRQGEFKIKATSSKLKDQLKWAAVAAGIILLLAVINQVLDYSLQTRRLDNIKKQISFIFKKNYPEATSMIDPLQQLKTKLAENKKAFGFHEGTAEITVVDLLKDISGFIPPSLEIIIANFTYENDVVIIKGEAKNIDAVSAVKSELMKSKHFKEVSIGATSLAKQGSKVEFDLRIALK